MRKLTKLILKKHKISIRLKNKDIITKIGDKILCIKHDYIGKEVCDLLSRPITVSSVGSNKLVRFKPIFDSDSDLELSLLRPTDDWITL